MTHIEISEKDFSLEDILTYLKADEVGATVFYVGTVKNSRKQLIRMEIDADDHAFLNTLEEVCTHVYQLFPIRDIYIHHRKGSLKPQDSILLIGVSAPHRQDAYEANRVILEKIKTVVPVSRKEIFMENPGK
ncbi:MAG: molybdenum cofactor biosynthesis protein MoaE [Theionarchaea archaeon]|nr:molybdenum cofactor biosynthesis protein MoaE [Theionarchaea archaeon]